MAGIQRMARELIVDEASLAVETMQAVGPGGSYLGSRHTFENFRQELWMPALLERGNLETWMQGGALDIFKKCEKELIARLEAAADPLLAPEVEAQIDAVVEAAVIGKDV
jgi:trimethylamine--corrinoid protein Co-methyltransferase